MKVCVIGGGLAGMSTALAVKRYGIEVTLLEASGYDRCCAGEHLVSQGINALASLGSPAAIWESNSVNCDEIQSAWGSGEFYTKDSILNPYGGGVLLTRPDFDAELSQYVRKSGIDLRTDSRGCYLKRRLNQWLIKYKSKRGSKELIADFVVDATGRNTKFALSLGAIKLKYDNLIAITGFITPGEFKHEMPAGTIKIEATSYGWCYSAILKDRTLVVSLMTDNNIAAEYGTTEKAFRYLIPSTNIGSNIIKNGGEFETITACSAQTQILNKVSGDGWLSVGDAAWSADPLSSSGMFKAIRSGINAAKAINDCQLKKVSALERYAHEVRTEFYKYLAERARYYRMEVRWRNEDFWKKRHPLNWLESPVKIHPMHRIEFDPDVSPKKRQHIRNVVPSIDLDLLINVLSKSTTACETVEVYKKSAAGSVTDKEIIVAVQELLAL